MKAVESLQHKAKLLDVLYAIKILCCTGPEKHLFRM